MPDSSSPEYRPFVPQPSPLRVAAQRPQGISTISAAHGRDQYYHPQRHDMNVVLDSHSSPPTSTAGPQYRTSSLGQRHERTPRQRTDTGTMSRRRPPKAGEPQVHRPSPAVTASEGHFGSFGQFQAAGIEDLLDTDDFGATFNAGAFLSQTDDGGVPMVKPSHPDTDNSFNILDRSPTPPYERHETPVPRPPSRPTSRRELRGSRRSKSRDDLGDGSVSKKSIENAIERTFGVELHGANDAIAKTFIRPEPPLDLLDYPVINHPRVALHVSIMQPLYSGGSTVAGRLNIHIRGTRLDDIRLGRASVDITGVEELSFSRKTMFMGIASELVDEDHPPPAAMLMPADNEQKTFWKVKPSRSYVPFRLNLPLNVGPGPFHSVRARIRYVIHGTVMVSINGTKTVVRCSRDIRIISALDPETALLPLEKPLVSTEEHTLRWGGHKTLKVTAGLQRAVWVAGTAVYVDVNIINHTNRRISQIRCKLRRHILAYKNTVALADNKSAGHLRVPSWIEKKTLSHSELNVGSRWKGVRGSQLDVITCEIEIPRNQLSVKMGRYFEVKYLVDVAVCTLASRPVHVQLPVTIVHMNSLDIMPNDLNSVTMAIHDQYGRTTAKSYLPGRPFVAPREHVLKALLPEPLTPMKAPLQPRKSSLKIPNRVSTLRSRKKDDMGTVKFDFDLPLAGGGPMEEMEIFDRQQAEHYQSRQRSTGSGGDGGSRVGGIRSTKDLLRELEQLKE